MRWDLCMQTMRDLGVTAVIELPPAGTLTGLVKRALPGVETVALKTPDDLAAARLLVTTNHRDLHMADAPAWRLVVAPIAGTFAPATLEVGSSLTAGTALGAVASRRETAQIAAPGGGTLLEWLAEEGDPVSPGQPLVRLQPEVALS